jgi:hypothetical protein
MGDEIDKKNDYMPSPNPCIKLENFSASWSDVQKNISFKKR